MIVYALTQKGERENSVRIISDATGVVQIYRCREKAKTAAAGYVGEAVSVTKMKLKVEREK